MSRFSGDQWNLSMPNAYDPFRQQQQSTLGMVYASNGAANHHAARLTIDVAPLGLWGRLGLVDGARFAYVVTLLLWAALGALAVYVSMHTTGDERACLSPYGGISFDMITWLDVFGWTSIGLVAALLLCVGGALLHSEWADITAWRLFGLGFSFHLAWFIVGSVLYWRTVNTRGDACSSLLRQATFAIWVIECVVFGLWFLGVGTVHYRRRAVSITLRV
jgi:hypothetical protein